MASLERFHGPRGLLGYRSPALGRLGVPHAFTTRVGELDLTAVAPHAARDLAALAGSPPVAVARVRQVHGAGVTSAERVLDAAEPPEADAVLAEHPEHLALVRVADCVPILLAGPTGARVAAVHAGWRGIVAGVVPRALVALGECAAAAIGPCISAERFEVGPEVADAFRAAELAEAVVERGVARPHVDLRFAVRVQILRARPDLAETLDGTDRCTYRDDGELWSHRRDVTHGGAPTTGRQGAAIVPAR